MSFWLYHGDCVEVMRTWVECSIDAICTDPPYGLKFMNRKWDDLGSDAGAQIDWHRRWAEQALRVLKPGAHLLAFSGTRTYHYLVLGLELAGFEVRDSLHWFYGTGFPKSLNGDGLGTALKPGHEPVVLARKALDGTVQETLDRWGTGVLNIGSCLLDRDERYEPVERMNERAVGESAAFAMAPGPRGGGAKGRWPSNVLLDEEAAAELDAQTGEMKQAGSIGAHTAAAAVARAQNVAYNAHRAPRGEWKAYGDSGGASRFFYVAKPSRSEREAGCEELPLKSAGDVTDREDGSAGLKSPRAGAGRTSGARNHHPTVKPVTLMRYLCRLITPPGMFVLDPFAGSGTTGVAALQEGLRFVGIERETEFLPIINSRLNHVGARS